MSTNGQTPPPLNESDMLDWIEGRLSRIEEGNRASKTRTGVADRVRQMQANRRALQSLGTEKAPAELMDRVMAALERETLLGLANGENVEDHLPISIEPHLKAKKRRGSDRLVPALALAAGVALLVAGTVYMGSVMFKHTKPQQPIATGPSPIDGTEIATNDQKPDPVVTPTPEKPADTRIAEAAPAVPAELSTARILELARQGKLVMHVAAKDMKGLAQVEALRSWHITRDVPQQVLAAVLPPPPAPFTRPTMDPTAFAGTFEPATAAQSVLGPELPPLFPLEATHRGPTAYLVELPNTEQALTQIKQAFATRLRGSISFEELDATLDLPKTEDPDTLLWWTLPPAQWVEHVTMPVVVEQK